jgi:hypothetical protein
MNKQYQAFLHTPAADEILAAPFKIAILPDEIGGSG